MDLSAFLADEGEPPPSSLLALGRALITLYVIEQKPADPGPTRWTCSPPVVRLMRSAADTQNRMLTFVHHP